MSEPESSSKDVVIGISIGLVILAGLYWYLSPGDTTPNTAKQPAVAQDNATQAKPKRSPNADETTEEPSIKVRKTKNGVFVERTEPLKSDPAFYREKSVFERSPAEHPGMPMSREQAANGSASGAGANTTSNEAANGQPVPDGDVPVNEGERTKGNQAGGWY